MQFTITLATPAAASASGKAVPTYNSLKAPDVNEAVHKVTGESGIVSQITATVWLWETWTYKGFAYAHPDA